MRYSERTLAVATAALMTSVLATACGGRQKIGYNQYGQPMQQQKGMTAGRKLAWLAGSAALYYMLKRNEHQRAQGVAVPKYYLSSNGQVYYRDASGTVHWVSPPAGGIQVPQSVAQEYNLHQFQGYDGQQQGRSLAGSNPSQPY